MAVLGVKIDNLSDKVVGSIIERDKLWSMHLQLHHDQETRLRRLEALCHDEKPVVNRVVSLEKWQEGQNVRIGRIALIQTTLSAGIATITAWIMGKTA